jgi:hypothetical protein
MPLLEIVLDLGPPSSLKDFYNLPLISGSLLALHIALRLGFKDMVRLLLEVYIVKQDGWRGIYSSASRYREGPLGSRKDTFKCKGGKSRESVKS